MSDQELGATKNWERPGTGCSSRQGMRSAFRKNTSSQHPTIMMYDMSKTDNIDRIWDIIELVAVCMLITRFADGLRARPLESRPDRDAGTI